MTDPHVTLAEMDALFGPDWRHPYCRWPRRTAVERADAQPGKSERPAQGQTERRGQQMRLGEK